MTQEEIIQAISDDKMMPFIQLDQLAQIVAFVINNYTPSILSDLDEASQHDAIRAYVMPEDGNIDKVFKVQEARIFHEIGFKAGAEWMAGQGYTFETIMQEDDVDELVPTCPDMYNYGYSCGDKTIVQIRKKQ